MARTKLKARAGKPAQGLTGKPMAKQKAKGSKQAQGLTKKQVKRRERKQKKRQLAEAGVEHNPPPNQHNPPRNPLDEGVVVPNADFQQPAKDGGALEGVVELEENVVSVEVSEGVVLGTNASRVQESDIRNSLVGKLAEALLSQQLEEESRAAKKRGKPSDEETRVGDQGEPSDEGTRVGSPAKKRAKLEKTPGKKKEKKKGKKAQSPADKVGGVHPISAEGKEARLPEKEGGIHTSKAKGPEIQYEASSAHAVLHNGQSLMIDGVTNVTLLSGSASIHGYRLKAETETLVSSSGLLAPVPLVVQQKERGGGGGDGTAGDETNGSEAKLLFRSCWPKRSKGQKEGQRSFRLEAKAAAGSQRAHPNGSAAEPSPSKSKGLDIKLQPTIIPFSWKTVTDSIVKEISPQNGIPESSLGDERGASDTAAFSGRPPIVAICGGKNVGKSTYGRYLLNRLLSRYPTVAYLETDVGQPEFTVPGLLSLQLVTEPVFGPPNMHLRDPDMALFYGDVSAKADPHLFLRCVVALYDCFRREHYDVAPPGEQLPLVINTHGWIKGLGLDVLIDILRYTVPTHVVDVQSSKATKNLPPGNFWETTPEPLSRVHYLPTAVPAEAEANTPFGHKYAPEERALRLLAHFQRAADFRGPTAFPFNERDAYSSLARCLATKRPYQVRLDAVRIRHLHGHVPPEEALWALNGALVGLAREAEEDSTGPLPTCLDVGLVRGVDPEKGVLFLVTCLPLAQLQKVNTLVQGKLDLPLQLMSAAPYVSPYLSFNSITAEGTGSATIRSRNNIARKGGD